jgi:hypothetical protein
MIRNEYRFDRALSEDEARLLVELVGWRRGSRLIEEESRVVGCVAHFDDVEEFRKELRKRGMRLKFSVSTADPEASANDAGTPRKWGEIKDENVPF